MYLEKINLPEDVKKIVSGAEVLKGLAINGSEVNKSEKQIKKWLEERLE